jgi:thioredoxin reductase (NADPH)
MGEERRVPLVIIGGGPAGLTAAIYAVRAGIEAELFERGVAGGQMFGTYKIENYPGFPEGISGPELSDRMRDQALKLGAKIEQAEISTVELRGEDKVVKFGDGRVVLCDALIVATGSRPNELGVPGEKELWGRGVSYCATCDGNFFRGQKVAVVGGGDSAVQEAHMLSHLCSEVTIIHRRDRFRAQDAVSRSALGRANIKVIWDTVVDKVEGVQGVEALKLRNVRGGELSRLPVEGVFIYVGVTPITGFVKGVVELTPEGYILAGEDTKTSVPGIFAAGDCRIKPARQIVTAVADGANAVKAVELYLIDRGQSGRYV